MQETPTGQPKRLDVIKAWVHSHPRASIAIVLAFILVLVSVMVIAARRPESPPVSNTNSQPPKPAPKYYAPLTGIQVDDEAVTTKPVTAVMIENSPDARPQSGLKDAEVVYEAVAEGGITRFLALYQQNKPKLIGPVRSVRMYYVDWLSSYDASVAHVGGSAKALKLLRKGDYRDIDQFFNPNTYWRATDRYAPHNVYTSFKKLDSLNKSKKYKESNPKVILRGDSNDDSKRNATKVSIDISGPSYNSTYSYSKKTKLYTRSQAGAAHKDREKGKIRTKVIVALRVSMQKVFEDGYRESIKTVGKGKAVVFQDGHATKVTWSKKSRASELQFYDKNGEPFELARGTTWIAAVPTDGGGVSWK